MTADRMTKQNLRKFPLREACAETSLAWLNSRRVGGNGAPGSPDALGLRSGTGTDFGRRASELVFDQPLRSSLAICILRLELPFTGRLKRKTREILTGAC